MPDTTIDTTATTYTPSALADGTWYFHVRSVTSGGVGSDTSTYKVNIDTSTPTASDNAPATGWANSATTVTLHAADAGGPGIPKTQYRVYGTSTWYDLAATTAMNANQFVVDAPADHSNDGVHKFEYRAVDMGGNVSATGTCSVGIDTVSSIGAVRPDRDHSEHQHHSGLLLDRRHRQHRRQRRELPVGHRPKRHQDIQLCLFRQPYAGHKLYLQHADCRQLLHAHQGGRCRRQHQRQCRLPVHR